MYHSCATQNNHFYSASPVLNVGVIKVAIDDSLVLYAALFGPRICGSRPNRFSNQKKHTYLDSVGQIQMQRSGNHVSEYTSVYVLLPDLARFILRR